MRLLPAIAFLTISAMTIMSAQLPGDRPAGNPRGTRSPVFARNGVIATSRRPAAVPRSRNNANGSHQMRSL